MQFVGLRDKKGKSPALTNLIAFVSGLIHGTTLELLLLIYIERSFIRWYDPTTIRKVRPYLPSLLSISA